MTELAKLITVDHANHKLIIDGTEFPWHVAEHGPVITRSADGELHLVTVAILAEDVKDDR